MHPADPSDHPPDRDARPCPTRGGGDKPVLGPMEALIADLIKLRDQGGVPPGWAEKRLDSWKDSKELYVELDLESVTDSYFDLTVLGNKVFIAIHV